MLFARLIPFALAAWLGFFLLRRGQHPRLQYTGSGLLFYAAALEAGPPGLSLALRLLPPLLWVGAILHLDQRIQDGHPVLYGLWRWVLVPVTLLLGGFFLVDPAAASRSPYVWLELIVGVAPLLWTLLLVQDFIALFRARQVAGILFAATIFFGLGEGFLLFPNEWLSSEIVLSALGIDLLLLGLCIGWFDAFDEGETFLPDLIRSFVLSLIVITIFAGQVGFVIAIQTGLTAGMRALLTTTILTSILLAVFGADLQRRLDRYVLSGAPAVREARERLVTESAVLSRKAPGLNLAHLDEDERSRLTRRALSHYGDLTRLASSPLTQLPAIEARLRAGGRPDSTLDRAAELKALLTESIHKLKPQSEKDFDTTDEWRFYNALYFPYVAGLRPYGRNQAMDLASHEQEAVRWFRSQVPQRTLHNWQNAGARLIANDLWEGNFR